MFSLQLNVAGDILACHRQPPVLMIYWNTRHIYCHACSCIYTTRQSLLKYTPLSLLPSAFTLWHRILLNKLPPGLVGTGSRLYQHYIVDFYCNLWVCTYSQLWTCALKTLRRNFYPRRDTFSNISGWWNYSRYWLLEAFFISAVIFIVAIDTSRVKTMSIPNNSYKLKTRSSCN